MADWDSGDEDGFPANRFGGPPRRDRGQQPPQAGGWSATRGRFQTGGRAQARRGGPYGGGGGGGGGDSDDDSAGPSFSSGRGSSWGAPGRGGRGGGRFGRDSRGKDDDDDAGNEDEDDDDRLDYIALGTPVELPSTMTATGAQANEPVKRKAPWQQEVGAAVRPLCGA